MRPKRHLPIVLIGPVFVLIFAFIAYPMIEIVRISFTGWHYLKPGSDTFVGFASYIKVFSDPVVLSVMGRTVIWMVAATALSIILGMAIGYYLSQDWKINRFLRAVIIIPWILPPVVTGTIWKWMLHGTFGVFNDMLIRVHIIDQGIPWLGRPETALLALIMVQVWKNVPMVALLLSAAFQGVSLEMVEAGRIDGANVWQRFWRLIFPDIRSTFVVVAVMVSIWCIQQYVIIWIATQGGPINSTHILPTYIFQIFTQSYQFGELGVLSITNLLILVGITLVYIRAFQRER